MPKNRSCIFMVGLITGMFVTNACFAALTDEFMGKAVNVASSLSRGDANGAVQGAIGGYNVPLASQANLFLAPGNVWYRQGIKPLGFRNPYFNLGSTYNAGATFGFNGVPNLSQNFQVNSGNGYFSNTTTVPVNLNRR